MRLINYKLENKRKLDADQMKLMIFIRGNIIKYVLRTECLIQIIIIIRKK